MKKVLYITSIWIKGEERQRSYYNRFERLKSSDPPMCERLNDYLIHYFGIVTQTYVGTLSKFVNNIDIDELFARIKLKIDAFQPNYVILHTGVVFSVNRDLLYELLRRTRVSYPNILCGIEHRYGNCVPPCHDSVEIRKVEELMFREPDAKNDDAIDADEGG